MIRPATKHYFLLEDGVIVGKDAIGADYDPESATFSFAAPQVGAVEVSEDTFFSTNLGGLQSGGSWLPPKTRPPVSSFENVARVGGLISRMQDLIKEAEQAITDLLSEVSILKTDIAVSNTTVNDSLQLLEDRVTALEQR